jgi:hypothetical protein
MKVGMTYSKPIAATAITTLLAACGIAWINSALKSDAEGRKRRASDRDASLSAQVVERASYENFSLEALRDEIGRFRVQLGGEGTWENLARMFGERWKAEPGQQEDKDGYSIRFGTLRLSSPETGDWPGIMEAVRKCEATPGVGVTDIEIKTSGNRERRSMDLVRIAVAVETNRLGSKLANTQ